jgi:hypothetical protein
MHVHVSTRQARRSAAHTHACAGAAAPAAQRIGGRTRYAPISHPRQRSHKRVQRLLLWRVTSVFSGLFVV